MIDGMCFVYALSYNGNVFYIGKAQDLAVRYKSHLRGYRCLHVHYYIKQILSMGDVPIMKPVSYLPIKDATKKEIELINLFSMAGHELLNETNLYRPAWPHQHLPLHINKQSILSYLKEYQKSKEDIHAYWKKIETNEQTTSNQ
jgi:hypothetical protein